MPEPFRLKRNERNRLNEEGYVVREAMFTPDACAQIAGRYPTARELNSFLTRRSAQSVAR